MSASVAALDHKSSLAFDAQLTNHKESICLLRAEAQNTRTVIYPNDAHWHVRKQPMDCRSVNFEADILTAPDVVLGTHTRTNKVQSVA